MTVNELVAAVEAVEVVTDEAGNKKVVVDWAIWEELMTLLEDMEDEEEFRQARLEDDEVIPWEQIKAEYLAAHPDADV